MDFFKQLQEDTANGQIPEKVSQLLGQFYINYVRELETHNADTSTLEPIFLVFLKLVKQQISSPYAFQPYHQKIRTPFDYYSFGLDFLRHLIHFPLSSISGLENLQEIDLHARLAGDVGMAVPNISYQAAWCWILEHHSKLLMARNSVYGAQLALTLARRTPWVPDLDIAAVIQRDFTTLPDQPWVYSLKSTVPIPVWDKNRGNILAAEGALAHANQGYALARDSLASTLADAYGRYDTNKTTVDYYRRDIIGDQVQSWRGLWERHQEDPDAVQFTDVVAAQQTLAQTIQTYRADAGRAMASGGRSGRPDGSRRPVPDRHGRIAGATAAVPADRRAGTTGCSPAGVSTVDGTRFGTGRTRGLACSAQVAVILSEAKDLAPRVAECSHRLHQQQQQHHGRIAPAKIAPHSQSGTSFLRRLRHGRQLVSRPGRRLLRRHLPKFFQKVGRRGPVQRLSDQHLLGGPGRAAVADRRALRGLDGLLAHLRRLLGRDGQRRGAAQPGR